MQKTDNWRRRTWFSVMNLVVASALWFSVGTAAGIVQPSEIPLIRYVASENTIYVQNSPGRKEAVADLQYIAAAMAKNGKGVLLEESPGVWILRANLRVEERVTLRISGDAVDWLKLKSTRDGYVWLRSNGILLLENTRVTSWDSGLGDFDKDYSDGRSFIVSEGPSRMDIMNSELMYL